MDSLWGAITFHLATIILGAVGLRQLKRISSNGVVAAAFFALLAAQSIPTLLSMTFARQPGMEAMLYVTFFFLLPLGGLAAIVWFVIGGLCAMVSAKGS
jgi:hypothetical protein